MKEKEAAVKYFQEMKKVLGFSKEDKEIREGFDGTFLIAKFSEGTECFTLVDIDIPKARRSEVKSLKAEINSVLEIINTFICIYEDYEEFREEFLSLINLREKILKEKKKSL